MMFKWKISLGILLLFIDVSTYSFLKAKDKPTEPLIESSKHGKILTKNKVTKSIVKISKTKRKLIILSIDGFPAYYLDHPEVLNQIPNLKNLFAKSQGGRIATINPSVTYASHTSMITGQDPGFHGIEGNTPIDPFDLEDGAWLWYYDDIKVETLLDIAKQENAKTANVYWPVTVAAPIDWNIPQFWRKKTNSDLKILRSLSTPGLHREMEKKNKQPVLETTKDDAKIRTGIEIFLKYKPDITLIYSTDLDTYHHAKGPFSDQAIEKLKLTDRYVGELIHKTNLYKRKDLALIVVSDHGFTTAKSICRPNKLLLEMNYLQPQDKTWKYYVKSTGGLAFLVENEKYSESKQNPSTFLSAENNPERMNLLYSLSSKIKEECKGVRMIFAGDEFENYRKKSFPLSLAIILSDESTYISTSWTGDLYSDVQNPIFTHGFPAYRGDMDTIGFFYSNIRTQESLSKNPKSKSKDNIQNLGFESVKDVFAFTCMWMKWDCKSNLKKED